MKSLWSVTVLVIQGVFVMEATAEMHALVGQSVTQKRGVVCVSDDFVAYSNRGKGSDRFWRLDSEIAVGIVKSVDGNSAIVEFENDDGWEKWGVAEKKDTYFYDYWGERLTVRRGNDSIVFDRHENGLLITGESESNGAGTLNVPIRVQFPLACISLPPPRFGDSVVRGPDWNKGSADGEPGLKGRIIPRSDGDPMPRGRDGYVTVEWEATKRKGRYRWDYHRKFDVVPVAKSK